MSDTSSVAPVSGASYFGQTPVPKKSDLNMTTFLNLLVTQLQNQDPTKPMDDASFYAQIAQLGQVQGMQQLNASADLSQAQNLMGKTVSAIRPTSSDNGQQGDVFTGTVSQIVFKNGSQYLGVTEPNGGVVQIQISAIQSVVPSVDVSGLSNLIGKKVGGTVTTNGASSSVIGVVQGVGANNGVAVAEVLTSAGSTVEVPVANLQQISA